MKIPKVSIILPTYNGAKYIRQSIDSCLNQTHKNVELIIIDDGSTDESPKIIKSYQDERIKYIRYVKNKGLPHALNIGFANATGEYLTWTSDDNIYSKEAIEKMLSFLKEKNCQFVYCNFYRFYDENTSDLNIVKLPTILALENYNDIGACFLYSREVKETIGDYDSDVALAEDYDYWIRVSKKFSMCHLAEPLYFCRVHIDSLSLRFRKQYEVQTIAILVRVKNNIIDVEQATMQFIDFLAEKTVLKLSTIRFLYISFLISKQIFKSLYRVRFSKKISIIIRDFQMGKISFEKAKLGLKEIINRRLI